MKTDKETFYARFRRYPVECGYLHVAQWRSMYIYGQTEEAVKAFIKKQTLYSGLIAVILAMAFIAVLIVSAIFFHMKGTVVFLYVGMGLCLLCILYCFWMYNANKKLQQEHNCKVIQLPIE